MMAYTLRSLGLLGWLAVAAAPAAGQGVNAAPDEERVSRSTEGFSRERGPDELRDPFTLKEQRSAKRSKIQPKSVGPNSLQSPSFGDAWIYDASTELFQDLDLDGYYHYLRVQFDADTIFDSTLVYVQIFLSADGVAWEHLYTTKDFRIWGTDPMDDYEVETDLVSGYSTGQYDVLIELYDSATGELLDEFGPRESSALSLLPLEDSGRDGVTVAAPPTTVTYVEGGGGAMSWWVLLGLLGVLVAECRYRTAA
jgi:hypothetical protein